MKKLLFIFVFLFWLTNLFANAPVLSIHFLDVGEGESIFIQTKDKTILIDTSSPVGAIKAYKYLLDLGVKELDYLVITHPHPDHFGGIFSLSQLLSIKQIFHNGQNIDNLLINDFFRWYKAILENNNAKVLHAGDQLHLYQNKILLKVIWPIKVSSRNTMNDNSLVFLLNYLDFHCLLTGDITKRVQEKITQDIPKLDIFKAPHHGAIDALSMEFLQKHQPTNIVCISKLNRRSKSYEKVLDFYKDVAENVFVNYKNGTVVVKVFEDGSYEIISEY